MKALVSVSIIAAALMAGGPALAQGLGANSDAPVDITADELEVQNKECISIWRGKAEAMQGNARLRADVLRAYMRPKGGSSSSIGTGACGDLIKMEASGSVYYVTPQQRVRGDAATYDAGSETVTMTGDVIAVQGENVLRGTRMVFNTKTGEGRMVGGATGRNNQARPRGVFYPSKKSEAQ